MTYYNKIKVKLKLFNNEYYTIFYFINHKAMAINMARPAPSRTEFEWSLFGVSNTEVFGAFVWFVVLKVGGAVTWPRS